MLTQLLISFGGGFAGAATGGLLVWRRRPKPRPVVSPEPEPPDEWTAAELDQAAAEWAMQEGRPEAASLMADKLHLLHGLGRRRGWTA